MSEKRLPLRTTHQQQAEWDIATSAVRLRLWHRDSQDPLSLTEIGAFLNGAIDRFIEEEERFVVGDAMDRAVSHYFPHKPPDWRSYVEECVRDLVQARGVFFRPDHVDEIVAKAIRACEDTIEQLSSYRQQPQET